MRYTEDKPGSLYEEARSLLRQDPRSLIDIHLESGLPFYWLKKVYDGRVRGPSVNRIQFLYEFLTGRSLTL